MQTSISGIVIIVGVVGRAGEEQMDMWIGLAVALLLSKISPARSLGWVACGMVAEPSQISRHL